MTTRNGLRIRLDGLSGRQLAILREGAEDWLVMKAEDLPRCVEDAEGTRREVEEVAALGRLVSGLRRGEVHVPDPMLRGLIARTVGETRHLDELKEEYDRELEEHGSWAALLARFDEPREDGPTEAGGDEDDGAGPGSSHGGAPAADPIARGLVVGLAGS